MTSDVRDFCAVILAEIDTRLLSLVDSLVACEAHQHDKIAGQITAHRSIKKHITSSLRTFTHDGDGGGDDRDGENANTRDGMRTAGRARRL